MRWRRLLASLWVVLGSACERQPAPVESTASPAALEAACAPPTSASDLARIEAAFLAQALSHAPRGERARAERTVRAQWARRRARILSGQLVLDVAVAEACLRSLDVTSTGPCSDSLIHARCATPEGSPCGSSEECEPSMYCDQPLTAAACQRMGHCRLRGLALGEPCSLDECAPTTEPGVRVGCWVPGAPGSRCLRIEPPHTAAHGEPCRSWTRPEAPPWTTSFVGCPEGDACVDGICQAIPSEAGPLEACEMVIVGSGRAMMRRPCAAGLYCDRDGICRPAETEPCEAGAFFSFGRPCPASDEAGSSLACVDGLCVVTDGTRDAACDYGSPQTDCQTGLACRANGRCGDLLAEGEPCNVVSDLYGSECASGCCAGGLLGIVPGVCVAMAP